MRDLSRAPEFDQTNVFRKLYEEEYGFLGGEPLGVVVGAYEFSMAPPDVELLERMSQVVAACHAPFLAGAEPHMFGLESFMRLPELKEIDTIFGSPEAAYWKKFRESEDSRYVGLTLPRTLLRLPYGKETVPVEEFDFEEVVDVRDPSTLLWGNTAFVLAARITDAFARHGWATAIQGVEGGGLVEGLPIFTFHTPEGDIEATTPTEAPIDPKQEHDLADAGFIPLIHARHTDYAAFFSVNSVQKPRQYMSPEASATARLTTQLPYTLAVSRFAHYLKCMARDKIGAFMSREQTEVFFNRWIANYVSIEDNPSTERRAKFPLREARVDVVETPGKPGHYKAVAYLRPHFQLDEITISLRVVIDLPYRAR
jgi:type VI secretion system protein ImpC